MATHHGNNGSVSVGANGVAEIDNWTVREAADTADDSAMGDTWKSHLAGMYEWSGSLTCHWDETDTNGQEALTRGASVTLNLYPEGSGAGATYKTGTATITEITIDVNRNGVVSRSFNFQGNGALTQTTVGA